VVCGPPFFGDNAGLRTVHPQKEKCENSFNLCHLNYLNHGKGTGRQKGKEERAHKDGKRKKSRKATEKGFQAAGLTPRTGLAK
jgi:hypothetical protein